MSYQPTTAENLLDHLATDNHRLYITLRLASLSYSYIDSRAGLPELAIIKTIFIKNL